MIVKLQLRAQVGIRSPEEFAAAEILDVLRPDMIPGEGAFDRERKEGSSEYHGIPEHVLVEEIEA
jgi:hypothetical protein